MPALRRSLKSSGQISSDIVNSFADEEGKITTCESRRRVIKCARFLLIYMNAVQEYRRVHAVP